MPDSSDIPHTATIYALRAAGLVAPLGMPVANPLLSWAVSSDAGIDMTAGFVVELAESAAGLAAADGIVWSSGHLPQPWARYDGPSLGSRARRAWRVRATRTDGAAIVSDTSSLETGLGSAREWDGQWIAAPSLRYTRENFNPVPHFRREFQFESAVDAAPPLARLYITALGIYRVWLNGRELTARTLLRPGWTDYRVRVFHQTFDCADALRPGTNVLAAVVAPGWYAGRLGLLREPGLYGTRPALRAQLEIGGGVATATDTAWHCGYGSIVASDLLRGEIQDLRQEPHGWREAGFDAAAQGWGAAERVDHDDIPIDPQPHRSVEPHRIHPGRLVRAHARGPAVFDFGQNLVGWTRVATTNFASTEVIVRHGEILTPEELVYRDNLRGAFQEDRYQADGEGLATLEPGHTLHGFRYAEVWGLPSTDPYGNQVLPTDTTVEAVSVTGLGDLMGEFTCSDDRLTALARAVEWTVRDNFIEVATDCPQRDERLGWLADASVIAPTASYLFDLQAFLVKFTGDAADGQGPNGEIYNYAPNVPPGGLRPGAPGWSDGYIRLVHLLALRYGEFDAAEQLFGSMVCYLDFVERGNPAGLRVNDVGADFGDWLSLPEDPDAQYHRGYAYTGAYSTTPHPIVDTAHTYRSFVQVAEIASLLGRDEQSAGIAERAESIRQAYLTAFMADDGTIRGGTQTAYAQAIGFDLLRGDDAERAAGHLATMINRQGHLTTGIHGVQHVLDVLTRHGHADLAERMLLRDGYPGWLYMVDRGATTIWEKWNGIGEDGSLATAEMNSFNHCALGAVGGYLIEHVAGLQAGDIGSTAQFTVAASYPQSLDWAAVRCESPVGLLASSWRRSGRDIVHAVTVPGASHARFEVPAGVSAQCATARQDAGGLVLGPGQHDVVLRKAPPP